MPSEFSRSIKERIWGLPNWIKSFIRNPWIWIYSAIAFSSKHLGGLFRRINSGWMATLGHLLIIIALVSIFCVAITPLDPLDLENKSKKINISSDDGLFYNLLIDRYIELNDDSIGFSSLFSEKDEFHILLSDGEIFDYVLNNDTLNATIMNGTIFKQITADETIFNSTFSNKTILSGPLSNKTALKKLLDNREIYISILLEDDIKQALNKNNISYWIDVPAKLLIDFSYPKNNISIGDKSKEVRWSSKDKSAYYLLSDGYFYSINNVSIDNNTTKGPANRETFGILLSDLYGLNSSNGSSEALGIALNASYTNSTVFVWVQSAQKGLNKSDLDAGNKSELMISFLNNESLIDLKSIISSDDLLLNLALKQAYDDIKLRQIFYLESINDATLREKFRKNIIDNITITNGVIDLIFANDKLRDSALNDIYKNNETREQAYSLMNKDKNLRGLLFKQNYMPWLKVIAIIWFYWYEILIIWIAFEALFVLFKSRKILSISEFSHNSIDEGTETTTKNIVTGLSTLLAVKLGRLNQLYRQVNEERQISSVAITSNPFPASFESKDIQELSSSTIASEIKLTAGKLTIPTTLVNGLIDAIITRPKLNGALHNPANNGSPILTANLIDGLRNLTWRVDGKDKPLDAKEDALGSGTETKRTRDDMVNELACRIFTDMTFGEGQMIPWKATFYFTEGVKCYRDSLHGQSDKLTKLHQASDYLKKTLSQDENFPWAHYNLGVVYTEMEQHESAKEAFEKSIEVNPDQWQSCYALALNLFEHENKWDDAIGLSEKALYLKPDCLGKAKVYDLLGLAWRKKDNKEKSVENLTKGVIHSLHGLIIAELSGKGQIPAGSVVSKCLSDLADMYNANDDIKPLLKLAAHYSPYDSYVHSRLVAVNDRNLREALKELHRSSSPANAEYWADAACYIVNDYKDSSMLDATVIEILDEFCDAKPECLCKVIEKIRSLNRDHESLSKPLSHLCAIKKFNCQEAINDNYTSDLSYWVDIKGQLHKLWAMRDTPCLSHIKDESPKEIDDLKNIGKIIKEISNNFKPGEKCNPQLGEIIKKLASGLDSLSSKDFWNEIVKFSNIEAGSKAYDERKILRICEELKYSYMLRDIGDICYLFGINIAAANKKTSAAKKIYNDIFKNILIFSKDEIPHEYERLKEDLRIRWRINYGKVEEGEFERNLQLTAKHPLSALHHMNLGRSYFWLNNYVLARSEWNQALLLNPNDPRPIFNIALTYIKESSTLRIDNDIRKSNYAQAEIKLKEALDLSNDTRRKLKINYWLGALKYSNKEYAQAISYYKIAKSLSEDCGLKDKDALLIKNYLGCAYLNLKRYSHGIDELKSLINMDYGDLNKEVGIDIGKPILKGYIMILARLNLALSILQRDADLDEADRCINVACEKIGLFSANKGESKEGLDAFWLDCRGWYLYKKYTSIISPPNTSEAKVKAAEIRVPRIAGSNATVKSGKITGIYSGQKDCCSSIESKDGMLLLKYFNIQNAELNDLKCEGSAINKLVLKSGLIKQGTFKESLPIEKDSVEKGIVKIKDNHGKYSDLLFGYAKIENTSIKDFIIENAVLDQTELIVNDIVINSGEVKSEKGIDEAIKCLEKSIFISAKPSAYLHLALAYELKINEESNQKARDLWKNKALASCQHCKDLDLNDEYKEEADKLEARLNATNGSNPPANKTAGGDAGGKNPKA